MSNSTIDQQFIEFVVKTIVGNPDAVKVERTIDEKGVLLELTVDPEDLGRVIGKRGSGAQALRTLLRALGTKNDARYNLKIIDVGDGESRSRRQDEEYKPQDKPEDKPKVSDEEPDSPAEQPVEESKEEVREVSEPETSSEDEQDDASDMAAKTRKELADLDDLDI